MRITHTLAFALGALAMTGAAAYGPAPFDFKDAPDNCLTIEAGDVVEQYWTAYEPGGPGTASFAAIEFVLTEKLVLPAGRRLRIGSTPTLNVALDMCEAFGDGFCEVYGGTDAQGLPAPQVPR